MKFPKQATIIEVMPRDGLQSWHTPISTENKLKIIHKLSDTGLTRMEVTSFVPPALIPQFRDAKEIISQLPKTNAISYRALVPNVKGAERAIEAGCKDLLGFVSCSETYSLKNQRKTIKENLEEAKKLISLAQEAGVHITMGLTNAFHCAFEGEIPASEVYRIYDILYQQGVRSFYLGATTGVASPRQVYERLYYLKQYKEEAELGLHLHNLHGFAYANVLAALQAGVTTFESSMLGIGGGIVKGNQPVPGNVSTSMLVNFLHSRGVDTGMNEDKLHAYEKEIAALLYREES